MMPLDQVVIIGAGPAGCSAACHLARAGVRVILIESKSFPRVKVCGEYVSPAGTGDLEALISADELAAMGARRVDCFTIARHTRGHDQRINWRTPASAWTLSRARLDEVLLKRAEWIGARVLQPAAVRDVAYRKDGATVRLASGVQIEASMVIHADGSGRHDLAGPTPAATGLVGLKCHARLAPHECAENSVEMRAGDGQYIGCVRVENDLATVALCASASLVRSHASNHDAMVARCWPNWSASWRVTDWLGSPVARSWFILPGHVRSFRVGNAAAAVDPVGGEGIASALWSGRTLARLLLGKDSENSGPPMTPMDLRRIHARFAHLYAARLRTRLPACRLGAELLMRPRALAAVWPFMRVPRVTIAPWYALTGKPTREAASLAHPAP